jgi:hypothetical protein
MEKIANIQKAASFYATDKTKFATDFHQSILSSNMAI